MQQSAQETSTRTHQGTCLIVEDSEFDSVKMTRVMEKSRHNLKVEVAATLRRARAALARGQTELILLDNNLPDGLGANFALELARDAKLSSIPSAGVTYVLNKTDFNTRYVNAALQKSRKRKTVSI